MIAIELTIEAGGWPPEETLRALARRAVDAACAQLKLDVGSELSMLFTGDAQIRKLNVAWRGKDTPTNVLSFPASPMVAGDAPGPVLGDIVLAYETVVREAGAEGKPFEDHLAHLVIHGLLHLIGYDHESDDQAEVMEALERKILHDLAIADPYDVTGDRRIS